MARNPFGERESYSHHPPGARRETPCSPRVFAVPRRPWNPGGKSLTGAPTVPTIRADPAAPGRPLTGAGPADLTAAFASNRILPFPMSGGSPPSAAEECA